jgi:two-component system chemotaxis response regulator CheY
VPLARFTPVLVVDGRATAIKIIRDLLEGLGFSSVETTRDGAVALDILRQKGPRLTIADLHMRPVSGLQILRAIRSDEKLRRCPFIMAVAGLSAEQASVVKYAGADGLVLKPFTRITLASKVEEVLATRRIMGTRLDTTLSDAVSSSLRNHIERAR